MTASQTTTSANDPPGGSMSEEMQTFLAEIEAHLDQDVVPF